MDEAWAVGIIGGSGLYAMDGLEGAGEFEVVTPFGPPSDRVFGGMLAGRKVYFLPRHGRGHRWLPHEIPHRANLWALRSLGVRWLVCVTAVGSLREEAAPRDVVAVDQYLDRTTRRGEHTFFGDGIAAHVAFGEPVSAGLHGLVVAAAREAGCRVHPSGTYVCMDGPAFSTRAESHAHRMLGGTVVGMTNLAEAKLARESEMASATLAMVTDYDCWRDGEEAVTAGAVMAHLDANTAAARRILAALIPRIPVVPDWPEHRSLDGAIMTPRAHWPETTVERLRPILGRFL